MNGFLWHLGALARDSSVNGDRDAAYIFNRPKLRRSIRSSSSCWMRSERAPHRSRPWRIRRHPLPYLADDAVQAIPVLLGKRFEPTVDVADRYTLVRFVLLCPRCDLRGWLGGRLDTRTLGSSCRRLRVLLRPQRLQSGRITSDTRLDAPLRHVDDMLVLADALLLPLGQTYISRNIIRNLSWWKSLKKIQKFTVTCGFAHGAQKCPQKFATCLLATSSSLSPLVVSHP